jgi:hypothetical protein
MVTIGGMTHMNHETNLESSEIAADGSSTLILLFYFKEEEKGVLKCRGQTNENYLLIILSFCAVLAQKKNTGSLGLLTKCWLPYCIITQTFFMTCRVKTLCTTTGTLQ